MSDIVLTWAFPPNSLPGEVVEGQFYLRNTGKDAFPGGRLFMKANNFYQTDSARVGILPPYMKNPQSISLSLHTNRVQIDSIPSHAVVELRSESGTVVKSFDLAQQMSFYLSPLINLCKDNPRPTNILLFGLAGSGKSSFLNSCCTLLSDDVVPLTPAGVADASGHVTKEVFRYPLSKFRPELKAQIVDCWGLTPDTYSDETLTLLLSGHLPNGFEVTEDLADPDVRSALAGLTNAKDREVQAILFFVSQASIGDPALEAVRQRLKQFYLRLANLHYQPLVVITKVDQVSNNFFNNPLGTYPEVESLRGKAASALGVQPNAIVFNLNYFKHTEKVFDIDRLNYRILREALQRARDFQAFAKDVAAAPGKPKRNWS